jgi:hypothetical protein
MRRASGEEVESMADANAEVHHRINALIEEEHRLREQGQEGQAQDAGLSDAERATRLAELEIQLDQAWDLLRQRQARREWDQDPGRAAERPVRVVENYEN